MAKQKNENQDLLAMALSATKGNISKSRSGSGRITYLDRFVANLLDENGQPVSPKSKTQIIAEISLEIALEERQEQIAAGDDVKEFVLTAAGDTEDDKIFAAINKKVKNQVNSAVANNKNSTSVSYNVKYKDVWQVVKEAGLISLAPVDASEKSSEEEE